MKYSLIATPLLRAEGAALLLLSLLLYGLQAQPWHWLFWGFLLPDLALLAYLISPRAGALAYNSTHSTTGPIIWMAAAMMFALSPAPALIWLAHIGFDRALGFGLKSTRGFRFTHLGEVGGH